MDTPRQDRMTRNVTVSILFSSFAFAFVNSITSVLVNEIIDTFALTGAAQGLLSSLLSVGVMAALVAAPLFQGRVQKMTMLTLSAAVQVLMLVLTGFSPTFVLFGAFMVCLGMGYGIMDTYTNACLVDIHPHDSSKYMGMLHGLFAIGSLLAPIPMQALLGAAGWRSVHFAIAALMLLATALAFYARRNVPAAGAAAMEEQPLTAAALLAYLKNGRNMALMLCGGLSAMMQMGLVCWVVRYMLVAHDAEAMGATCLTAYWVAATVNRFLAPRLRFRRMTMITVGAVASAVCLAVGVWSNSPLVMCLCCGLVGITSGHFQPMVIDECARGYRGNTTLTSAAMMFVMGLGRVIMPLLVASVSAAFTVTAGMSLSVYAAALTALFGAIVMRLPAPQDA